MSSIINQFIEKFENAEGILTDIPKEELEALISAISEKPKKERKSKTKDPNAPKRGMSGYFFFLGEKRKEISDGLDETIKGRDRVTQTTKLAGAQWKSLNEEEKKPYLEKAVEDKKRYQEEMKEYCPVDIVEKVVYDVEELPEAPEGWKGPFEMKYLSKVAKGLDGKNPKQCKSFEDAITLANELEGCFGITKTSRGYSLRIGPEMKETDESDRKQGMASWVKETTEPDSDDEYHECHI